MWAPDEGGAGLDPFETSAMLNAIRAAGGPTVGPGTTMLTANAIRALGSPALQARILPGVAAGETLICLGYTEPEGGSDVFACKTRSVRDGDEWVINGQKMFTTFAHRADYCFLLTRSDPDSHGPRGLTMFLVPMETPGIEIQAVRTMGYERTNIVFYNDVRVSDELRVGEPEQGLHVMRAALEAEQNVAPSSRTSQLYEAAVAWAREDTLSGRRHHHAGRSVRASAPGPYGDRRRGGGSAWHSGRIPRATRRQAGASCRTLRPRDLRPLVQGGHGHGRARQAMADWTDPEAVVGGTFEYHFRCSVASTIYGGSSEVLRSLIAEQLLGTAA